MPLPPSGADIVNQIRSTAIAAVDFGLRTNGPKANNVVGAIQYNSSKPVGFKRQSILTLQEKLNNLVFDPALPSTYFNTINTFLANQPVPTIVTTTVTPSLATYFSGRGITLTPGTPILNLATTNQGGLQVFNIQQIEQINPGDNHYIYFSDARPIQIGNTTIQITNATPKKLRVTPNSGNPTEYDFGDDILIDGETFQFLGSGSGGLFIYKGRNYTILNTTNTVTTEVIDPTLNNIDGCGVDSIGNVYLCDHGNNRVLKYDPAGNLISTFDSGFNNPRGIAVDFNDNVYVTNYDGNTISRISSIGTVLEQFANINKPYGIYFKNNKFYVSCLDSVRILDLNPTTYDIGSFDSITSFDSTYKLRGIAVDTLGNIYVSSQKTDVIYKINVSKAVSAFYSGLSKPNGLTIDTSNNLYVANSGANTIIKITSVNTGSEFSIQHTNPQGLAINSNILYITNKKASPIDRIVLNINNYTEGLNNIGFPINGTIKWICKNRKYSRREFYVLINVTDSTQNIDMIYTCSITNQGAVYTKVCDYSYGNYGFTSIFQNAPTNNLPNELGPSGPYQTVNNQWSVPHIQPETIYGRYREYIRTSMDPNEGNGYKRYVYKYLINGKYSPDGIQSAFTSNPINFNTRNFNPPLNIGPNPFRNRITPKCMTSDASGNIYITNYGNSEEKDLPAIYKYDINTKQFSDFIVGTPEDTFYGIELIYNRYLYVSNTNQNKIFTYDLTSTTLTKPVNILLNVINPTFFIDLSNFSRQLEVYSLSSKKLFRIYMTFNVPSISDDNFNFKVSTSATAIPVTAATTIRDSDETYIGRVFTSEGLVYQTQPLPGSTVTPPGTSGPEMTYYRILSQIDFKQATYVIEDQDRYIYIIGGNKNIFRLYPTRLELVNTLPTINLKQGFLPTFSNFYGTVTTFAGGSGVPGWLDGTAINSKFTYPNGVAFDSHGNLFVADRGNHCIRKITPGGVVSTFAGAVGVSGWVDGTGTNARFNNPHGLAIDSDNTIYVADTYNHLIRKITPQGVVTLYAGLVSEGYGGIGGKRDGRSTRFNGIGPDALFRSPTGIAVTRNKHVYVADTENNSIRLIVPGPGGGVITIAGGFTSGNIDGQGETARFNYPTGIAIDSNRPGEDIIYVSDFRNNRIRKVTLEDFSNTIPSRGLVTTITSVFINNPTGIVVDLFSNIYVAESGNSRIRKITPEGELSIVAGDSTLAGFTNGVGVNSRFNSPYGLAIDQSNYNLYVSDINNNSIRKIDIKGNIIHVCDSDLNSVVGYQVPRFNTKSNINIGGIDRFDNPKGIVKDSSGNLYVLSIGDKTIYKITDTTITPYIIGLPSPNGGITITPDRTIYTTNTNNTISKIFINSTSFTASLSAPVGSVVTATVSSTANLRVGNVIQITDSSTPSNTGTFTILDIPSLTTFQFFNPEGFISTTATCVNTSPILEEFFDGIGGNLKYPTDLVINNTGIMYILNKDGRTITILVMGTSPTHISQIDIGDTSTICSGVVIDSSNNNLYFLNQSANSIGKVNTNNLDVTPSFITGINNATDIYYEDDKLYILTTERKYYLIDLTAYYPTPTLKLLNSETYLPSTSVGTTTTTITQPVIIPDGTEYINFVLIGGGGSGSSTKGGGSGAQLKFRIKVGLFDPITGNYVAFKNRREFTFEVGKGGAIGNNNGGDTKINFYNNGGIIPSQEDLIDVFVAGGGKSGINGGKGGIFPRIIGGSTQGLNIANVANNPFKYITDYNNDLRKFVLVTSQLNEGAAGDQFNFVDLIGSMTGNDGLESDNLFNIDGLGGDLNNTILKLDPNNTQLGPSNILNANFKKLPTPSSSKNFNLGLYPPGKGGDSGISGNDGLVAWFFEGPSQYTINTLHPGFRVPLSLMNQTFDTNWFTLPFKADSAIISGQDLNNSNNTTATFLCDTDGNITLVDGGSGYSAAVPSFFPSGEVRLRRSLNSIFGSNDDILIIVNSVGVTGNILTWSLYPGLVNGPTRDYKLYEIIVPDGVTKVDVAMIGSGGSPGAFVREPLVTLSTDLVFSIIVTYTNTEIVTYNKDISWLYIISKPEGTTTNSTNHTVSFTIPAGNYPLKQFVDKINKIISDREFENRSYYNLHFSFQPLGPEDFSSPTRPLYGFVLNNPVVFQDHTDVTMDATGKIDLLYERYIQTYSMQLLIDSRSQVDPYIFYSQQMNNAFGPIHTYTINDLGRGKTLKTISFPLNIVNGGSRASITADPLTDGHIIQPLPSFDGGDGSSGQYIRRIFDVYPGGKLEVKIGRNVESVIIPRTAPINNIFSYGIANAASEPQRINGFNGKDSYIQLDSNTITRITALGGLGGLPNPKTNVGKAGKPELPPGSELFTYPNTGLPPGWQKGYGASGITIRDTNQYDNPILRSSHGCAMIKFS
jgi:sugar lactone lactonase YvrE